MRVAPAPSLLTICGLEADTASFEAWLDPQVHRGWALRCEAEGRQLEASAHRIAVQALEALESPAPAAAPCEALATVATGFFMLERHEDAQRWYALLLHLDANRAEAFQNLAALHEHAGRGALARACRDRAYALRRVFIETPPAAVRRLLILCMGDAAGNIPLGTLLGSGRSVAIKYILDRSRPEEDAALPAHDLVLNAIGEPDLSGSLSQRMASFAAGCSRPWLNPPEHVAVTRRDRLAALLRGMPDLVLPPCLRLQGPLSPEALEVLLQEQALAFPLLLRPAGSHGGRGLVRCDEFASLQQALGANPQAHYLSEFRDYRSADGQHRKFRMIFIGGEPLPYHLAISPHWLVHYRSADMEAAPWKQAEEQVFLQDWQTRLGPRAVTALRTLGQRLRLDYAGVDFSLLPDGSVLLFEANATMLVHLERQQGPLAYRNRSVRAIIQAFDDWLSLRMTRPS